MQIGSEDKARCSVEAQKEFGAFRTQRLYEKQGTAGPPVDLKRLVSGD